MTGTKTTTSASSDEYPPLPRRALMRWYAGNGRHALPWRLTREPYAVLVSEVMLQQTQVDRVLLRYQAWLQRWPTAAALAGASLADVIREWGGLGYNRRAVNLHRAARVIAAQGFPTTVAGLRCLPGVGTYTAAAVASFAFNEHVAVADTNIARCIARVLLGQPSQRGVSPKVIAAAGSAMLPREDSRSHNLALMDLGAIVCQAKVPRCGECPLRAVCEWRRAGFPADEAARKPAPRFEDSARFARGRIVDALRATQQLSTREIVDVLPPSHHQPLDRYLASLERDGLVARTPSGDWALPAASEITTAG
ncbi:MAG: A/G-specific adenine glycosylase [Anaerolinea sp.]|nr:A/G-specific adenine glycosylase [Anaerolinea sp.]